MEEKPVGAKFVRVLRGGQITLPIEFRRALDIDEGMLFAMYLGQDGDLHMLPAPIPVASGINSPGLKELHEHFEPVRSEIAEEGLSDEEIYQLIDEAVAEVRAERRRRAAGEQSDEMSSGDAILRTA